MMDSATRLQIPDETVPGPSQTTRQAGATRPLSANVYTTAPPTGSQTHGGNPTSRKQRASHTVTSQAQVEDSPIYRDVYSHPAAVAYAAAHPRRTIPKFGPYLLLQTLGEGEFGKVKLGLHGQWGEEVAVKLIRRGNIDTAVRQSKVEREIEVLRTIKHPNIVRLYDVIETDKYIGIILEYASGGELFDHILAHRYLKERDACKLFSQLISGVWYIHQKKIVHRDLKLENLLLDRNRNVIITDFGFANRFEHRADDLMQTSCGSPCYAAPELVISEGLYVGSAVDIWSCGVILYAMLAGYLPFDDDPANPDGDNINLLYKYIVNTPLTFPDYISAEARDLLSMMLVPDPQRRADLESIMAHSWLGPYSHLFDRGVAELEKMAMDQHQLKRLAYQRQMKQQAAAAAGLPEKVQRAQSARTDTTVTASASASAPRVRGAHPPPTQNPVFLYETAADGNFYSPSPAAPSNPNRRNAVSAVVLPTPQALDDDPFGPSPTTETPTTSPGVTYPSSPDDVIAEGDARGEPRAKKSKERTGSQRKPVPSPNVTPVKTSPEKRKADRQRHTLQLEYVGDEEDAGSVPKQPSAKERERAIQREADERMQVDASQPSDPNVHRSASKGRQQTPRKSSLGADGQVAKPLPSPPSTTTPSTAKRSASVRSAQGPPPSRSDTATPTKMYRTPETPTVAISPSSPTKNDSNGVVPQTPDENGIDLHRGPGSTGSGGSRSSKGKHRKGISVDKFVGKLWGNGNDSTSGYRSPSSNGSTSGLPTPSPTSTSSKTSPEPVKSKRPSSKSRVASMLTTPISSKAAPPMDTEKSVDSKEKKSRRNTLTVMVEPFSRQIKQRTKGRSATGDAVAPTPSPGPKEKVSTVPPVPASAQTDRIPPLAPHFADVSRPGITPGIPASTSKASKVMQWFRYRSKGGPAPEAVDEFETISHPDAEDGNVTPTATTFRDKTNTAAMSSSDTLNRPKVVVTSPTTETPIKSPLNAVSPSTSRVSENSVPPTPHVSLPTRAFNALGLNPLSNSFNKNAIRVHHGAVDQTTVTSGSPPEVMKHVTKVLQDMGLEVQYETDFKYRCIRPKKKKALGGTSSGALTAFTMVGSAASNGVDKRGLPVPSASIGGASGMLRGLLMRRQSSQVSSTNSQQPEAEVNPDLSGSSSFSKEGVAPLPSSNTVEAIYGDRSTDQGDEVRFSVELTRIDGLDDTFSLDIRRLKGNLRSYKFLYDTLRDRADLQR